MKTIPWLIHQTADTLFTARIQFIRTSIVAEIRVSLTTEDELPLRQVLGRCGAGSAAAV